MKWLSALRLRHRARDTERRMQDAIAEARLAVKHAEILRLELLQIERELAQLTKTHGGER